MKLSIIMPFKNAEPWVSDTINSIQAQDFRDWELICIDDGSTDSGVDILQTYSDNDDRIQLHLNDQTGIIPALQKGIRLAKGEFISRMDADDIMPKGRLTLMVNTLGQTAEKTIVTGKVRYFSKDEVSNGYRAYEAWLNDRIDRKDHFSELFRECVVASPNWMARRDELVHDKIIASLNYPEDYDMSFRWFENGYTIHGIDEVTLLWREHPNRTSRNSDKYDQASFFQLKLNWFLKLNNLDNRKIALFGAGQKGKLTAKFLIDNEVDFHWYDQKFLNYNTPIFDQRIGNPMDANEELALFCVYPNPIDQLNDFLIKKKYTIGSNCWLL